MIGFYVYVCFYYGVYDYFSVIFCCFGIFVNIVNIIILIWKLMRILINIILIGIVVLDMFIMLLYFVYVVYFWIVYGINDEYGKYIYGWSMFLVFYICLIFIIYMIFIWLGVCMFVVRYMYIFILGNWLLGIDDRCLCIFVVVVFLLFIIVYIL